MARASRRLTIDNGGSFRRTGPVAVLAVAASLLVVDVGSALGQATAASREDAFALLGDLVGSWEGTIEGSLGTGTGVRDYELILDDQFLLWRHASVRLPQPSSPEGDHHRELGVFSYDTERERLILREFMVEGVVDRYVCELEDRRIDCVAEHVESGPGISARLTLDIHDAYRFDERFELMLPGNERPIVFTNRWSRVPKLR